jgi:hypothetical protein
MIFKLCLPSKVLLTFLALTWFLSRPLEEHERHLRVLYDRLQTYGILIIPAKCVFRASEVTFIGYKVSSEGSRSLEERVAHYQDCPLQRLPVNSVASWACGTFIGDFCLTLLRPRHHYMTHTPAPESRALIKSPGRRISIGPLESAR